ncbi:MAG: rRNA pseudouridine synthase [Streptococcaceae bacterium]|jgi:16S rRNA pseudouridine516 synthase|nr:rRNA pseudouridine synthase [Streptococcaceae bacterium]
MRLDKYLAQSGLGTRSEVKTLIKQKRVTVNDARVLTSNFQVDVNADAVAFDGVLVQHQTLFYYMMNKPAGTVSVTKDNVHKTVLELLSAADFRADIFPAGRLDKDTEGLLLLTNDGDLAHAVLSPHKHVEKEYFARISGRVTQKTRTQFHDGVTLHGEKGNPFTGALTLVSADEDAETSEIRLVIHRGVYHQVKRMFKAVGMEVTSLKRLRMGSLQLDETLAPGHYRALTADEIDSLKNIR